MKNINITNGQYLNNFLESKYEGVFIPFNEAMIQGNLLYPIFDDVFIKKRSLVHNVTKELYLSNISNFLNIEKYIHEVESITLWFGKDAFCIINLLTVLVYFENLNYQKDIILNIVDDASCELLESNIQIKLGNFKTLYLKLIDGDIIKTDVMVIDNGIQDYLFITSDNNHVIEYIKENINKLDKQQLLINLTEKTYEYGLSDTFILSLINKVNNQYN